MTNCLAVLLHQLDPYAIKLWEDGPVRWYGLSYLVGFLLAYLLVRRVTTAGVSTAGGQKVGDLVVTIAVGVVIGGRLGYVLFYQPSMLWTFSSGLPYWDLLAINKGGMASHGGIIGAIAACFHFARRHGDRPSHILDLAAFGAPIGLCIGRFANFVNGELYGRACDPSLPWAVKFPQEMAHWDLVADPERRTALQRAVELVAPGGGGDPKAWLPELLAAIQRSNEQVIQIVAPHITARHPSQVYQALLEGLAVFIILAVVWSRPRKPGVIGGLFLVSYGVMRVIGEIYRLPDEHIANMEAAQLHMSRGQLLSVPVIAAGLVMIWHFARKQSPLMGGWGKCRMADDLTDPTDPSDS